MEEIWKDITGYEGLYKISNLGNVFSIRSNKTLIPHSMGIGYLGVGLYTKSKGVNKKIHKLIADYFIPNPENKKCVNHIDGNKLNNNINNLEWCTSLENNRHAWFNKLNRAPKYGDRIPNSIFKDNEIRELRKLIRSKLYTLTSIAKSYKVSLTTISSIKTNRTYGYVSDE